MSIEKITISDDILLSVYGVETMEEVRAIQKEEQELWCNDERHPFENSYYVPDTKEMKHHYRCPKCSKITQIG